MEAFAQKDYDVSLITDSHAFVAPKPDLTSIYVLPTLSAINAPYRLIPNFLEMIRILKKINPDLVHLHVQYHYAPAIILARFSFILTSWGLEVLTLPETHFPLRNLATFTARQALQVTVDAKFLKDIWADIGVPESKIQVIPFGINTDIFNPDANGQSIRKELQIDKNDVVIISTRYLLNDHYNVECLIRAIPLILKEHENAKFVVKGEGPLENYLKTLVRKLNVSKNVHFVHFVPYNKIAQYLRAADIYVSTCFVDSTSVSLLEAMACGLAPIVTDIPGNREWIENGVNGFLFPPKDSEALAQKITQLIESQHLRKTFGQKCFQIIKQRATWEKSVSDMETIYTSLISRKNRRRSFQEFEQPFSKHS
jgi:glycosyltransferase involved in cell wall biosynthesis